RDWGQVLQNNIDEFDPLRMIAAGTSEPPHGTRLRHEGERDDGARHGRYGQPDHFQAAPDENGDYRPISAGFFEWKSVACWNA
ncbi:MAG: hypothetical protein KIT73_18320, partial [Burkholderiales bacterium]|nr:hypothetical protein [Burkholderiales bacterium]